MKKHHIYRVFPTEDFRKTVTNAVLSSGVFKCDYCEYKIYGMCRLGHEESICNSFKLPAAPDAVQICSLCSYSSRKTTCKDTDIETLFCEYDPDNPDVINSISKPCNMFKEKNGGCVK